MSKKLPLSLLLVIILLGLSSCNPTCDLDSLQSPETTDPADAALVDSKDVTLKWSYPASGCVPENFEITVFQNDDMGNPIFTQDLPNTARSVSLPALAEVSYYSWQVRAKTGTTYSDGLGQMSNFFTGPLCDPSQLAEPDLVSPTTGGILYDAATLLVWDYPTTNCIPDSFLVELSIFQDFSDTSLNFQTDVPIKIKDIGHLLQPATKYFWRVSPVVDNVIGPPSWYRYFYTEPVCDVADLVAPLLTSPAHLSTVDRLNPWFDWQDSYQNCTPDGFKLQVSEFKDFSALAIDHNSLENYTPRFYFQDMLEDCKPYYWQVTPSSGGVLGPPSPISSFYTMTDDCPCDSDFILPPELGYPGGENWHLNITIVPDLNPTLEWSYPGSCIPDEYQVYLSRDIRFQDTSLNALVTGEENPSYTPTQLLRPATQYWWLTSAVLDGKVGPTPRPGVFFTGPECGSITEVNPPTLLEPENGAVITNLPWYLKYEPGAPGCIPDGYDINLQTSSDFSGDTLIGEINIPSTRLNLGTNLDDCMMYYWKVTAIQDGVLGAESEVHSFMLDLEGTCPVNSFDGTVNENVWCKPGPDWDINSYLFENGDNVMVVARNADFDQIQVLVPDENGEPKDPPEFCWIPLGAMTPFDYQYLPVKEPPAAPDSVGDPVSGGDPGVSSDSCFHTVEECTALGGDMYPYPECCVIN